MNDNVTLIPARRRAGNRISKEENKPKLKVAAYCRVSTDSDEQAGSYEVQVQHYTEYIGRNKDWELAGIYADDGISGTNTKKREGFNEMIDDCMAGKGHLHAGAGRNGQTSQSHEWNGWQKEKGLFQ